MRKKQDVVYIFISIRKSALIESVIGDLTNSVDNGNRILLKYLHRKKNSQFFQLVIIHFIQKSEK